MGWWARSGRSEPRLNEKGDDARSRRGGKKWGGEKEEERGRTREMERTERKERKGKGRKAVSSIPSKENSSKENRKEGTCARI